MAIELDYRSSAGAHEYSVRAKALHADDGPAEYFDLNLIGTDPAGSQIAEGHLVLPVSGLESCGQLLWQVLHGLAGLHDGAPPGRRRLPRGAPANSRAPWTAVLDEELRERWLASTQPTGAGPLLAELGRHFGRTANAIRSRLPRVGCDPDVPGRRFADTEADAEPVQGVQLRPVAD